MNVTLFRQLLAEWVSAGHDSDALANVFKKFAEFNQPFIPRYEKLLAEVEAEPHKQKAVTFWLQCLRAGTYPYPGSLDEPRTPFVQWIADNCPYINFDNGSIPNLCK